MDSAANSTTGTNGTGAGVDPTLALLASLTPAEIMGGLFVEIFVACMWVLVTRWSLPSPCGGRCAATPRLYGLTSLQAFIYYQTYPNDNKVLKWLVGIVWVLESVHTAVCIQFMYSYLIDGFANPLVFLVVEKGVGVTIVMSSCIALVVQGYYTWRVFIMSSRTYFLTGVIAFFALARIGFGIACAILTYKYPNWLVLRNLTISLTCVSGALGSAALVDLLVALTLTYLLKKRSDAYNRASQSMVNKILIYTVHTCAITGTASLLCVILFGTNKTSLAFLGLVEIQTKLYANSFLGSLNARVHIRGVGTSERSGPRVTTSTNSNHTGPVVEILRSTTTQVDRDFAVQMPMDVYDLKDMKSKHPALA
ncbi:uncharacterized protein BXZ73DRAFT_101043 [Epithele typhae]|uniref:uncharacterized protein n=1 Tax=Epithele typhae TaxID=378194 RepID=UPI0020081683|nr:uncharacterized protein BXZ73DRAFT_101043 [Epithele typhae]KAH9933660.1 hypothetical protein BXZ73DRAFT_101043 [Epithele typhae]